MKCYQPSPPVSAPFWKLHPLQERDRWDLHTLQFPAHHPTTKPLSSFNLAMWIAIYFGALPASSPWETGKTARNKTNQTVNSIATCTAVPFSALLYHNYLITAFATHQLYSAHSLPGRPPLSSPVSFLLQDHCEGFYFLTTTNSKLATCSSYLTTKWKGKKKVYLHRKILVESSTQANRRLCNTNQNNSEGENAATTEISLSFSSTTASLQTPPRHALSR